MGRFKSLRFDFYVFNFDTMKVILFGKSAEKPYGKLLLTKRNGTQVSYQYLRSDLVRVTGFEPAASCSQSRRATSCATPGYLLCFRFCGRPFGHCFARPGCGARRRLACAHPPFDRCPSVPSLLPPPAALGHAAQSRRATNCATPGNIFK